MSSPRIAAPRLRLLVFLVLLLAGAIALFELTELDLAVQDRCYDSAQGRWLVDAEAPLGRLVFYNGPKAALFPVALALLALAFGPAKWRERFAVDRRGLFAAILTLATVPALAGIGKNTTNTFCPSEIRRYGGDVPYVKLCEPYPSDDRPERRGHCFPAGHASGGFALAGLFWLRASRRWRQGALALGLAAGWWMGGYQMLKGAHYLSHTVVTMLLAWIVLLAWGTLLRCQRPPCASS